MAALVTSLPFTLFCIRKTPQEAGALPYGKPQTASGKPAGIDASKALKFPRVLHRVPVRGHHQPAYHRCPAVPELHESLTDVTFDALAVGVMMATVMMVAQAICKLALGVAADKNAKLSFIAAFVTGVAGVLLVWFGTGSEIMLYAGAAIYGFSSPLSSFWFPLSFVRFSAIASIPTFIPAISMFVNIMGAVGPVFWALPRRLRLPHSVCRRHRAAGRGFGAGSVQLQQGQDHSG